MADRAQGRPENRPGGDDSDPGLASRRERGLNCQKQKGTLFSAWAATTHSEGKGPENPGVLAPLAVAGCRGNRSFDTSLPSSSTVVTGSAGLHWIDAKRRVLRFFHGDKSLENVRHDPGACLVVQHCPQIYACLANLADNQGILALAAVGVIASSCFVGPSSSWGVLSSQTESRL